MYEYSGSLDRLSSARRWAELARVHDHETTFAAYKMTISLLQLALTISPTLDAQHDFIIGIDEDRLCPTSVLSALPFHAAGLIENGDGTTKYILDDYVSSYTPTLGTLINSRSGSCENDPTGLVIGDTSLRSAKEISNVRNSGMSTKLLVGKEASCDRVITASRKQEGSILFVMGL
ncbi:uncharacterized protein FOMMEDRAFT_156226 [Fomitiporia mediterranea MF3/22]|uniref:uncharacterized protein n=1 Tax=Fomitiporia mediterranea (strain MF3/22) TaxID=694068 RepID=UPI0004408FB0|nr:uncharacterized protein FOMMEDRAFT_156226 [Fomitiporia mediterranea MF3/22]EJD02867.1 hypothetical protein FOMMEDRAFT_156226 [Fomitiporia mediterranea MF3/22]